MAKNIKLPKVQIKAPLEPKKQAKQFKKKFNKIVSKAQSKFKGKKDILKDPYPK